MTRHDDAMDELRQYYIDELDKKDAELDRLRKTHAHNIAVYMSDCEMMGKMEAEIVRLRAALKPFAEVARWAERNGHDLMKGWDMLLRQPDGTFAGHLQVQSPEFIAARTALDNEQSTAD